jgi:hypothetical protein
MQLVTIDEYRRRCYSEASRPARRTVKRWIERGEFPSATIQRRGRRYFIDMHRLEGAPEADELVRRVLEQ